MKVAPSQFILFLICCQVLNAFSFVQSNPRTMGVRTTNMRTLEMSSDNNQDKFLREERLSKLGYSSEEIAKSSSSVDEQEEQEVKVVVIDDVDPVTLTAIGFAAIAFNFLVFANMGDAGISGAVARLINYFRN